jgi:diguanylate cyclase
VLVDLLQRLGTVEGGQDAVASLRERLVRPVPPADLPALIDAVADLIGSARKGIEEERRGLESFLSDVSARLAELGDSLSRSQADGQASEQGRQSLGEKVRERVAVMRVSVEHARDLDALKQAVRAGLAAVESHVGEHLRVEGQRHADAEARARAAAERLGRLEAETGRLRERLQRARAQAVRDPLTGLFNRLAYEERVAQAFTHWKRYRDPLSLVVLDVDRFKELNDRYGHVAGDRALRAISEGLVESLREADFIARYGGEEFVVLLPKTDLPAAGQVAEKLRRAVESRQFQYRDHRVAVTVSCGVAAFREGDGPETVFERADRALYRAKQAGRNRCDLG